MNKVAWTVAVALGLAANAMALSEESILRNAGFETGTNEVAAGWISFGKTAQRVSGVARGGVYSGKATGESTGQPNFAGFMQDHEARPGDQWVVSLWIRQDDTDPVMDKSEAFAKIEFYDKDGNFLDAMEAADRVTESSPRGSFVHSTVISVAPPNTKVVRFVAMFAQYDGKSKGTVYFDDGELRRVIKDE